MATLGFLDPPKAPDRIGRPEDDRRASRVDRLMRLVLCGLGILGVAVFALVVTAGASMMTSKQQWLSSIRAPYTVESFTLVDESGRAVAAECWSGSTVHLAARIKNQKVEAPMSSAVVVTVSGELDGAPRPWTVEETVVLQDSAIPRVGDFVTVFFSVNVPDWMENGTLVWTVQTVGDGDAAVDRGYLKKTLLPCEAGA